MSELLGSAVGLRVIATFEASKGALVLLAGFGLLVVVDEGAARFAQALIDHMHLNPAKGVPHIFIELMSDTSNRRLQWLAFGAIVYASLRWLEAFGLWRGRSWAEWLAVASGGIYIPFELADLAAGVTLFKLCALGVNVGVVAYMAWTLRSDRRRR
ncbi:MAG: DUF2127 domain-containing protein [Burkholderiaceae bacterium]|nr:DUF2127 domain-containing protein [Burkholderiaceae bacterium]